MTSAPARPRTSGSGGGRTWRAASGAWLGIGTAPGALVLGAQVGGRHGGALPVPVLVVGGAVMAALLAAQGRLGLREPAGENAGMAELAPRYLAPVAERAFTALLAVAMAGWFGFNVGLGGAAAAALGGVPDAVGVAALTVPTAAVLVAGGGRWNAVAVATTLTAVALIGIVAVKLAPPASPVSFARDGPPGVLAADLAGYIGYVSVFAVRAPDFTVGLRGRRDLAACVALLVVPALAASVVGAGVAAASGSTDVVAVLAGPDGLHAANLFVAASVIAPTLAAVHSGALAIDRFLPRPPTPAGDATPARDAAPARDTTPARGAIPAGDAVGAAGGRSVGGGGGSGLRWGVRVEGRRVVAVLAIALPGAVLAVLRVDRMLLEWLTVLAAALPALVPPMAAEFGRRRRGRAGRPVATWIWAPGAAVAVALTLAGHAAAAPAGLVVSAVATLVHAWFRRERS
ncbi:hypothetical protein BJY14_005930 [Actinomadura luteofluorescens]|uniref:Cytosine permease n=1 Tax=Actinomadura luteofluorescens TaxID=46163 RepID=A0A7Y9ELJ8_9ACTN|nr:hypothetical protein [Actinomadura luteofluorescens]NYD49947.1 hypothetical protein [Actinomadura luteofluorescens]